MSSASLIVRTRDREEFVYEIESPETLIGRSPSSHLRVPDESISREHAVILFEDEIYTIEDLQSTNGTQVNGKRIRSAKLDPGDEIRMGQTRLVFNLP